MCGLPTPAGGLHSRPAAHVGQAVQVRHGHQRSVDPVSAVHVSAGVFHPSRAGESGIHGARDSQMTSITAVDPGCTESAYVVLVNGRPTLHGKASNEELLKGLKSVHLSSDVLVIEQIESYGMAVGREVFETVYWSGRFAQAWRGQVERLPRRHVKLHLCGSAKANDANIRQALIDRFGPEKRTAIGTKAAQGPLYGIVKDQLAALAVAVTWWDQRNNPLHICRQPGFDASVHRCLGCHP